MAAAEANGVMGGGALVDVDQFRVDCGVRGGQARHERGGENLGRQRGYAFAGGIDAFLSDGGTVAAPTFLRQCRWPEGTDPTQSRRCLIIRSEGQRSPVLRVVESPLSRGKILKPGRVDPVDCPTVS